MIARAAAGSLLSGCHSGLPAVSAWCYPCAASYSLVRRCCWQLLGSGRSTEDFAGEKTNIADAILKGRQRALNSTPKPEQCSKCKEKKPKRPGKRRRERSQELRARAKLLRQQRRAHLQRNPQGSPGLEGGATPAAESARSVGGIKPESGGEARPSKRARKDEQGGAGGLGASRGGAAGGQREGAPAGQEREAPQKTQKKQKTGNSEKKAEKKAEKKGEKARKKPRWTDEQRAQKALARGEPKPQASNTTLARTPARAEGGRAAVSARAAAEQRRREALERMRSRGSSLLPKRVAPDAPGPSHMRFSDSDDDGE